MAKGRKERGRRKEMEKKESEERGGRGGGWEREKGRVGFKNPTLPLRCVFIAG